MCVVFLLGELPSPSSTGEPASGNRSESGRPQTTRIPIEISYTSTIIAAPLCQFACHMLRYGIPAHVKRVAKRQMVHLC